MIIKPIHRIQTEVSPAIVLINFLVIWLMLTSCNSAHQQPLIIATAANAQFAMEELAQEFEKTSGIATELIISSSGKHTAQIEAGAPYDIFISADMKYPKRLYANGYTTAAPEVYAYGQLVLWSLTSPELVNEDSILATTIKHFAIPNPLTAPYGVAAKEYLININKYDQLENRMVFGESVSQTNQYILSGAAELGLSAASVVLSVQNIAKGKWLKIDTSLYSPIAQGAVIIKSSNQLENANKFYLFLFTPEGQSILQRFGYKTIKHQ